MWLFWVGSGRDLASRHRFTPLDSAWTWGFGRGEAWSCCGSTSEWDEKNSTPPRFAPPYSIGLLYFSNTNFQLVLLILHISITNATIISGGILNHDHSSPVLLVCANLGREHADWEWGLYPESLCTKRVIRTSCSVLRTHLGRGQILLSHLSSQMGAPLVNNRTLCLELVLLVSRVHGHPGDSLFIPNITFGSALISFPWIDVWPPNCLLINTQRALILICLIFSWKVLSLNKDWKHEPELPLNLMYYILF